MAEEYTYDLGPFDQIVGFHFPRGLFGFHVFSKDPAVIGDYAFSLFGKKLGITKKARQSFPEALGPFVAHVTRKAERAFIFQSGGTKLQIDRIETGVPVFKEITVPDGARFWAGLSGRQFWGDAPTNFYKALSMCWVDVETDQVVTTEIFNDPTVVNGVGTSVLYTGLPGDPSQNWQLQQNVDDGKAAFLLLPEYEDTHFVKLVHATEFGVWETIDLFSASKYTHPVSAQKYSPVNTPFSVLSNPTASSEDGSIVYSTIAVQSLADNPVPADPLVITSQEQLFYKNGSLAHSFVQTPFGGTASMSPGNLVGLACSRDGGILAATVLTTMGGPFTQYSTQLFIYDGAAHVMAFNPSPFLPGIQSVIGVSDDGTVVWIDLFSAVTKFARKIADTWVVVHSEPTSTAGLAVDINKITGAVMFSDGGAFRRGVLVQDDEGGYSIQFGPAMSDPDSLTVPDESGEPVIYAGAHITLWARQLI